MLADPIAELKQQFGQVFSPGGMLHVIRAPGRVNLIGEHTDYNDGFVLPMAIEPEVRLVCRARQDSQVRIASTVFPGEIVTFTLEAPIPRGEPGWANYSRGVAAQLMGAGIPLVGMDALIANTLPVGGGLSSSAALEVATALALLRLVDEQVDLDRLALLCQKAEHEYALVPCGIMDQMIVTSGRAGHATLYDCRDGSRRYVRIDEHFLRVVIINSMVRHELSGGEYARRRRECEQAVEHFRRFRPEVRALRDVTMQEVRAAEGSLEEMILKRARHVVGENARTVEAAEALEQQQYERAGELMAQSHASLRDDYQVSCPELDFLSEESMKIKGVYGARMTGGGFGGCVVALAQPRSIEPLAAHLNHVYPQHFNLVPMIFVTSAAKGASVVE